jgi:hypothetical protein
MIGMDVFSVFCRQITKFSATSVKEAVYSPSYVFGAFVKNKIGIAVWLHIWVLYSVPLVFISVLCQYHAAFIAMAL